MNDNSIQICNWCNRLAVIVWVHGHGQCSVCGINVDECCSGEVCEKYSFKKEKSVEEDTEPEIN